ncbi:hypothetical protein [Kocuria sabuli]|uniref:hypothetical protein n=1 Tax=Kocuria sabuli TaxID=3071448 RepID=UPI0034D77C8F
MSEVSGLEAWAFFLLPLIGYPVLIIVQLIVETPVLGREPATQRRRNAATVLAVISLVAAAPLLVMGWTLGAFGVLLLGGLVVPAVLTLARLRQPPPATTTL